MNEPKVIEQSGQRVLTTSQLADAFETDTRVIHTNFTRNKDRYREGKHFFLLEGDTLRELKATTFQNDDSLRRINRLYLWTEKGAWLHAKSLNTERAWEAYERLVDDYYDIKSEQMTSAVQTVDERSVRVELLRTALLHEERLGNIEQRIDHLAKTITIDHAEQQIVRRTVARRVQEFASGEERKDLFRQLYSEIRDRWGVASYRDVKREELQEVVRYVEAWKPRMQLVG